MKAMRWLLVNFYAIFRALVDRDFSIAWQLACLMVIIPVRMVRIEFKLFMQWVRGL